MFPNPSIVLPVLSRLAYLTWLVVDQSSPQERHHTQLAMALITSLARGEQPGDRRQELSHLILTSHRLNAQFLLQQLRATDLYSEQPILQGRLGAPDRPLAPRRLQHAPGKAQQAPRMAPEGPRNLP